MTETTRKQLLQSAQSVRKTLESGLEKAGYTAKLTAGTLTVNDISAIADNTGKMLSFNLRKGIAGLTAEDLPLGDDFFNEIIPPMMRDNYDLLNAVSAEIQEAVDKSEGLKIATQAVDFPEERVATISKAAGRTETVEELQRLVTSPIETVSRSYADEYVKKNAAYRSQAGLACKLIRKTDGKACKWCESLAGEYDYGEEPQDIYRRHDNCGCTVTFINGRTAQNVWTKRSRTYDGELLEQTTEGLHVLDGNEQSFKELGKGIVGKERKK